MEKYYEYPLCTLSKVALNIEFAKTAHRGQKLPILGGEASFHVETKIAKGKNPEPLGGTN